MATTLRGKTFEIVEELQFEIQMCISCGIPMAVEQEYVRERKRDHRNFYCLNGHAQMYGGKTAEQELRETIAERDAAIARKQAELNGALDRLAATERSRAAVQGELTKAKKRVHAGVCTECNRTFANVANHMRSKHGTPAEIAAVVAEHKPATEATS